jgi:N-acylneuraminate cytidylyltransferase
MNIALIPARSGSKRIPDKNIRDFHGHPLMAYTIKLAKDFGFDKVIVSSDSDDYLEIAEKYGATPHKRKTSDDNECDFQWVENVLRFTILPDVGDYAVLSDFNFWLLRPTNPFRTQSMLIVARSMWERTPCMSLRAVSKVKQHPRKMWTANGLPFVSIDNPDMPRPWEHATQSLGTAHAQNGSLEIFKAGNVTDNISGDSICMFETDGYEGFDINTEDDWILAEQLVKRGLVKLPGVGCL